MEDLFENESAIFDSADAEMNIEKKICSFLPSVTYILQALGLEDRLVGVTFECPSDKPVVIHSALENQKLSVAEINEKIAWHQRENIAVNTIDKELLSKLKPDVIFTQELCNVCQIGEDDVCNALKDLDMEVELYSLNPKSFGDVEDTILLVADVAGEKERGEALIADLRAKVKPVVNQLMKGKAELKEVAFLEWLDPIFSAGHWIPDQLLMAGATDRLANPHGKSEMVAIEKLIDYDPEVIVISLCGMDFETSKKQAEAYLKEDFWSQLTAWKNKEIYLADGNLFTQPAAALFDGVHLLAGLFYPKEFEIPPALHDQFVKLV